ncbi:MAG: hypothetical protein BGO83_04195 [Devosia sp. 66-14]|nr:MAG: hypothetical protein BGO83_04195 [Devosia sp. 66-14]
MLHRHGPDLPDHLAAHRRIGAVERRLGDQRVIEHGDLALPHLEIGEIADRLGRQRRAGQMWLHQQRGKGTDFHAVGGAHGAREGQALAPAIALLRGLDRGHADPRRGTRCYGLDPLPEPQRRPADHFPQRRRIGARDPVQHAGRTCLVFHQDAVDIGPSRADQQVGAR